MDYFPDHTKSYVPRYTVQSFIRHAYGVYYTSMKWNLDFYAERLKDMSTRIPLRQLFLTVLLALMLSVLSACADGEAHLTVQYGWINGSGSQSQRKELRSWKNWTRQSHASDRRCIESK